MKSLLDLRSQLSLEVFSENDFHLAKRELSLTARYSLLGRLLRNGSIKKVSRGLYVFGEDWRRKPLSKFSIANKLVAPSYISFESALSHHGLIPESVYATTSACFQRNNKSFKTPFGDFTYQHVLTPVFALEIESIQTTSGTVLIATPMKALFDLISARRKHYESLRDIEADLRISEEELMKHAQALGYKGIEELGVSYHKKSCLSLVSILKKGL